jgi:YbbR-like protein
MIKRLFFHNWQRKLVAILAATVIWLFVNHSIIETKTIPYIPLRVINLPPGKTALGLGANGTLAKRINLTLTGTKDVIEKLEPGDLEVQVDASEIYHDEWVLHLTKKNLISLNPSINLTNHITQVQHNEYILRLSRLITDKIPVEITTFGDPPPGYEFLGIWPEQIMQTVTGPEKEIHEIKKEGIVLAINLNDITKEQLDKLQNLQKPPHNDEICYYLPDKLKYITVPFYKNPQIKELNDPDADNIRIDFLREELLSLERDIPIRLFYPIKYGDKLNPKNFPLATNDEIQEKNQLTYLSLPIFVSKVSQLFLDLIRDNIEIAVVIAPPEERQNLSWSFQIIDQGRIEDTYIAYWMANLAKDLPSPKKNEALLRQRFRNYMQKLTLHTSKEMPLNLFCQIDENSVKVNVEK